MPFTNDVAGPPPPDTDPVGFLGLGNMGAPMATKLFSWPGGLMVCDLRDDAVEPFLDKGARRGTPAELAASCRVVSVTVLDDAQVREVVAGPDGLLAHARDGLVIAIHSTIADSTAVELAERCAERGVGLVDAPVSGGSGGATEGNLATMVGASEGDFASVRPVFELWAGLVVHAGEPGAGTRMKLARNLLHFVSFTATAEAARLAEAAGLSITDLGNVVRHTDAITGGAGAIMYRDTAGPVAPGEFWEGVFGHVRGLGEKDLSLALGLGDRLGVDLPLAAHSLTGLGDALGVGPGPLATDYEENHR